jgi:hypothetical protein
MRERVNSKGDNDMTRAQYDAILEISENGERFAPHDLNVSKRTVVSLARRGWIKIENGMAVVTQEAWEAMG